MSEDREGVSENREMRIGMRQREKGFSKVGENEQVSIMIGEHGMSEREELGGMSVEGKE